MCAKLDVFSAHQYVFDYRYAAYVNLDQKTLFSHLFVAAYSAEEIEGAITRPNPAEAWRFYATEPTDPEIRDEILRSYGYDV